MYNEFLNQYILDKINENMSNFDKYLDSEEGKFKAQSKQEKNPDLDLSNIIEDARNGDKYAICLLRKDVSRQNIYEEAFFEYTRYMLGSPDLVRKLPQTGSNRTVFGNSKAADFQIYDWYGTQKYIKQSGGAQDNQINDAVMFAKEGLKRNKKIIICIDGDTALSKARSKLNNDKNLIICNTDQLLELFKNGRFN